MKWVRLFLGAYLAVGMAFVALLASGDVSIGMGRDQQYLLPVTKVDVASLVEVAKGTVKVKKAPAMAPTETVFSPELVRFGGAQASPAEQVHTSVVEMPAEEIAPTQTQVVEVAEEEDVPVIANVAPSEVSVNRPLNKVTFAKAGVYELTVSSDAVLGGVQSYPGLIITGEDEEGRCRCQVIRAYAARLANGNWRLAVDVNKSLPVSDSTAVVLDLGGSERTMLPLSQLVSYGARVERPKKEWTIEKKRYNRLFADFPRRPGFVVRVLMPVGFVAGMSVGGFFTGGGSIAAAIVPGASVLVGKLPGNTKHVAGQAMAATLAVINENK